MHLIVVSGLPYLTEIVHGIRFEFPHIESYICRYEFGYRGLIENTICISVGQSELRFSSLQ